MRVTLGGTTLRPELKAKVDESPDDSVFRVPGSGSTLTIESYTSEGNGTIEIDATVAASQMESGKYDRDVESPEGYTTDANTGHSHH